VPSVLVVGTVHDSVTLPFGGGGGVAEATVMLKGFSEADAWPSLTLIPMFENVPTFELVGVPLIVPVAMLNVAQEGRFCTVKLSVVPDGPLALGVKE
jgi:hypothetical protein